MDADKAKGLALALAGTGVSAAGLVAWRRGETSKRRAWVFLGVTLVGGGVAFDMGARNFLPITVAAPLGSMTIVWLSAAAYFQGRPPRVFGVVMVLVGQTAVVLAAPNAHDLTPDYDSLWALTTVGLGLAFLLLFLPSNGPVVAGVKPGVVGGFMQLAAQCAMQSVKHGYTIGVAVYGVATLVLLLFVAELMGAALDAHEPLKFHAVYMVALSLSVATISSLAFNELEELSLDKLSAVVVGTLLTSAGSYLLAVSSSSDVAVVAAQPTQPKPAPARAAAKAIAVVVVPSPFEEEEAEPLNGDDGSRESPGAVP